MIGQGTGLEVEVGMGERMCGTGEVLRERLPLNPPLMEDSMVVMMLLFETLLMVGLT